jgi:hypothetical protein
MVGFTLSGWTNVANTPSGQQIAVRLLLDGTAIGGSSAPGVTIDPFGDISGVFSIAYSQLVTITAGASHTLTLQWEIIPVLTGNQTEIFCTPVSYPNQFSRAITAVEF